ncbi:MAG TPA: NrfD/PsrC family molybdoenzyme membrane anchor subunit [Thermoleophilaceae bacterium]|nr:NrfD/PsrC family molybdoenzyme membrane anchor subunit [Thermoleophilaceae bacterium]
MSRPPRADAHAKPILKQPVWTWEIPLYFYTGGLGGASAALAFGARQAGNHPLERSSWALSMAGLSASPLLLTSDLGRPARFLNMLRTFKVTSPMSVGSWILTGAGMTTGVATLNAFTGLGESAARACRPAAALLGLPVTTYTAALIANTSVPVWHESRLELPFMFGASAVASAGAAAVLTTPPRHAAAARALAAGGALGEVALALLMERRLGPLADAQKSGAPGRLGKASKLLGVTGAALVAKPPGDRPRAAARLGAVMISGAAIAMRWSVFKAGSRSAADPAHTVGPQRERIERGEARGAAQTLFSRPGRGY